MGGLSTPGGTKQSLCHSETTPTVHSSYAGSIRASISIFTFLINFFYMKFSFLRSF